MKTGRSLDDLNNHLFSLIEEISNEDIDEKDLDKTLKRAGAVRGLAETVIANAGLALKAEKFAAEALDANKKLPSVFDGHIDTPRLPAETSGRGHR